MEIPERITSLLTDFCKNANCELIEAKARGAKNRIVLEIFIDCEKGIEHDDCRNISRQIDEVYETEPYFEDVLNVIVSSPGADRPLKFHWQFKRNVGRILICELNDDEKIEGVILDADEEKVSIEMKEKKVKSVKEIAYKDLIKAYIKLKF